MLALLAVAALALFLLNSAYWPLLLVLILELLVYSFFHKRAKAMIAEVSSNAEGLILFSQILERIEQEPFASRPPAGIRRGAKKPTKIRPPAPYASSQASSTGSTAATASSAASSTCPCSTQYKPPLQRNRGEGAAARGSVQWVAIVGEMEALFSLAGYSFEHPNDPFPEFAAGEDSHPLFEGEDLGHPLLPAAQCVRNSVRLDDDARLLLISGSNMSGKSTFLRTVGINAVLANAGAPIRANSLRLSPLLLGTRIRTTDSLQEGRSNFYTEILRIRQVFEQTNEQQPLLFLFDELLEGTNSKDRRIGAEGLLRALLARRSIGIVTTHDLALTEIAESLGGNVRNAHFQDFVEQGEMRFDYKLREGVVARSNALELMRLIGLNV